MSTEDLRLPADPAKARAEVARLAGLSRLLLASHILSADGKCCAACLQIGRAALAPCETAKWARRIDVAIRRWHAGQQRGGAADVTPSSQPIAQQGGRQVRELATV